MTGSATKRPRWWPLLLALASLAPLLLCLGVARASAASLTVPTSTRIVHKPGLLVPIPASIPHEAGDMVDSRIVPDLRWIAQRIPIYVTDGYSGPLADGTHVGCDECHAVGSDHYNGLAVDIVPALPSSKCDANWTGVSELALWAEPLQGHPILPFRWVGYEGDAGHGCGNHLHLSWNHAPAAKFTLAEWVEVFPVTPATGEPAPPVTTPPTPPAKPPVAKKKKKRKRAPKAAAGPTGGIPQSRTGGTDSHGGGGNRSGGFFD